MEVLINHGFIVITLHYFFAVDIDKLHDVLTSISDVVNQWFELGLALGLRQPTLESITSDHKREMLTKWLNRVDGCCPSWNALVKALRSPTVQKPIVADAIVRSHPSQSRTVT